MKTTFYFLIILIAISCKKDNLETNNIPPGKYGDIFWLVDSFRVMDAATCEIRVKNISNFMRFGSLNNQATFNDSLIYQVTPVALTCANAYTGTLKYQKSYAYSFNLIGLPPSWPLVLDSNLYVTALESGLIKLYCHDKNNGSIRWKSNASMGSELSLGFSSPVASGDKIVVTSHQSYFNLPDSFGVYCFNKHTGALIWARNSAIEMNTPSPFPIIIDNNKVIFTSSSYSYKGIVYCFDLNSGNLLWKTRLNDYAADIEIKYYNNELIIYGADLSYNGKLHRIDKMTGNPIGRYDMPGNFQNFDQTDGVISAEYYPTGCSNCSQQLITRTSFAGIKTWSKLLGHLLAARPIATDKYLYCIEQISPSTYQVEILDIKTGATVHISPQTYQPSFLQTYFIRDVNNKVYGFSRLAN